MKKVIRHDMFDISRRIKDIEPNYEIIFDTVRGNYEIHNKAQKGSTFCLFVPYSSLDARTLTLVRKTSVRYAKQIFDDIDSFNDREEKYNMKNIIDKTSEQIQKILKDKKETL